MEYTRCRLPSGSPEPPSKLIEKATKELHRGKRLLYSRSPPHNILVWAPS
jgi:hypothetical protein